MNRGLGLGLVALAGCRMPLPREVAQPTVSLRQSASCDWDEGQDDSNTRDDGFRCMMQTVLPDALELRYEAWRDAGRTTQHLGLGASYYFDW